MSDQSIDYNIVGHVGGELLLDLDYKEDSTARVDLNVVATVAGNIVEIQGTAEGEAVPRADLDKMTDLPFGLEWRLWPNEWGFFVFCNIAVPEADGGYYATRPSKHIWGWSMQEVLGGGLFTGKDYVDNANEAVDEAVKRSPACLKKESLGPLSLVIRIRATF